MVCFLKLAQSTRFLFLVYEVRPFAKSRLVFAGNEVKIMVHCNDRGAINSVLFTLLFCLFLMNSFFVRLKAKANTVVFSINSALIPNRLQKIFATIEKLRFEL